jgi:hypothetical protein
MEMLGRNGAVPEELACRLLDNTAPHRSKGKKTGVRALEKNQNLCLQVRTELDKKCRCQTKNIRLQAINVAFGQ